MNQSWDRAQSLFLQALDLRSEARAAFLDEACAGDAELRHEVESLLAHDGVSEQQIVEALKDTAQSLFASVAIEPGTRVGDYEVEKLIGSGGMGEVYQARDLRLARDVAIKVLPSLVRYDPGRLRRFEQEAQAAAALNHPNILAVFQMGTFEGAPYLVSELLEGATLREHMKRGPTPSRSAIDYGVQIGRGLAAAHQKGVTHRDLKPENVFVTKDGRVKILDFGLAKLTHAPRSSGPGQWATEEGLVLGTVGYMSPEQVRGEAADYRTDIFAFGATLYEMLSGTRAFQKPTSAETMSAILNEDPLSISQLAPATPPALQRVVNRCLEKNREQRFQSASDLAFALEALSDSAIAAVIAPATATPGVPIAIAAGDTIRSWRLRKLTFAMVAAVAVLLLAYRFRPAMPLPRISRVEQLTKSGGILPTSRLLTDGPRVYYRSLDEKAADFSNRQVLLNGHEDAALDIPGRFLIRGLSPDETEFLAITPGGEQSTVWAIPVAGGSPRRVGNLTADDIAWSHDGNWLAFTQANQLVLAKADGTSSRALATASVGIERIEQIRWSPDDRLLRFTLASAGPGGSVQYPTARALWEVGADGRNLRQLRFPWPGKEMECCGDWTPDGRYFFFRSQREGVSNLWSLEEKSDWWRRANREPVQLTAGPVNYYQPISSRAGKSVLAVGGQPSGQLVRYDAARKEFVPYLGGRSADHLEFTRDGQWLAYVAFPEGTLWRARSDGSELLQLTFPPLQVGSPRWSADGKRIAFNAVQPGQSWKLFVISVEGGSPQPLPSEGFAPSPADWMPGDGNSLIYGRAYAAENPALYRLDLRSERSEKIPGTDGLYGPVWSPDGRHLTAVNAATDVLLLVDLKTGKRTQIAGPARWPAWSADSRHIYFTRDGSNWLFRAKVSDGSEEKVLEVPFRGVVGIHLTSSWNFTLAPDDSPIILREHGRYDIYSLSLSIP